MTSPVRKRSIEIGGRETSVSLEAPFWLGLKTIAQRERVTVSQLVTRLAQQRKIRNLSSELRQYVLQELSGHV